jgi:hypothetical protein
MPLLLVSTTVAVIVEGIVPSCDTLAGLAVTTTLETAAAPIVIDRDPLDVPVLPDEDPDVLAAPENAVMTAVPDCDPALKVTTAVPLLVVAVADANDPSDVVKVTVVPFWTALPPLAMTVAVICAVPWSGRVSVLL